MELRTLQTEDLAALLALYEHLHMQDDPLPSPEVVGAVWRDALTSPHIRYFGGFDGDMLRSSCTIALVPNLTRGCRPYGLIENVVTHAAHRGQGWAGAVLRHALAFAWQRGCYKVMLMTGRQDEATLRFYENAGFDRHGKQAFVARPSA